jgi:predicted RNA-binding Zn-ribbon protein involved in translation (DUF1610 family)
MSVMLDNLENSDPNQYQSQWQAFRRRRNRIAALLFAEFLTFLPFVLLVVTVERRLFSTDKMAFPAAMLWGAVYIFTGSRLRSFPCPRCGKNFFGGIVATSGNVLGRSCANCGLHRYAGE